MFFVLLVYALFASVFTISKISLEYSQPYFLIGTRMALAGMILLSYQALFHRSQLSIKKSDLGRVFLLALVCIYLTNTLEFWGLKYLTSFKTCFIYSLSPFVSALLSYFIFSEMLTKRKWFGLLIGFSGFLPILLSQTHAEEEAGTLFLFSWAEIAVMLAAVFSVYGWILLKQLVKDNGYSFLTINGLSMLIGGVMALTHSRMTEEWTPVPVIEFLPFAACTLSLLLISNLISYNLYGWLLKRYSATFMSLAGLVTPIFSALYGWITLGEIVTWPFYISALVVSIGLTLFYQEELRVEYIPKRQVAVE
jgi:drug/metabolite transporter (DMT)-like permease